MRLLFGVLFFFLSQSAFSLEDPSISMASFQFTCHKPSAGSSFFVRGAYSAANVLTDVVVTDVPSFILSQDLVRAETGYVPRNPRFKDYYRFNLTPASSRGVYYYLLFPRPLSLQQRKPFTGYFMNGSDLAGGPGISQLVCQFLVISER